MIEIPLRRKDGSVRTTRIDDADVWLLSHRWHFDGMYAATKIAGRQTRLHRLLVGITMGPGVELDHINGDKLDNRRENLRLVAHKINGWNVPSQEGTSALRGVSWDKARSRWRAQARAHGHNYFLGRFDSEEEAADVVRHFWARAEAEARAQVPSEEEEPTHEPR